MKNWFEVPAELLANSVQELGSWAQTFLVDVSWYSHRKLMWTSWASRGCTIESQNVNFSTKE